MADSVLRWPGLPGTRASLAPLGGRVPDAGYEPDSGEPVPLWRNPEAAAMARRFLELMGFPQFDETWSDASTPEGLGGPGSKEWPGIYGDLLYRPRPMRRYQPPHRWLGQWEDYQPEMSEEEVPLMRRWGLTVGPVL